jgi:hypothetical protein
MKQVLALAVGMLAAAAIAQAAMATNDGKVTLGPSGYDAKGKSALVVAGTANVVLNADDRVVICRAKKSGYEQAARPAEHALGGNDAAGDIVPPFAVVSRKGDKDTSLAAGQNWTAANAAIYADGCDAPSPTTPASDVCPNIEGIQTAVPASLTKDGAGNCVVPVVSASPAVPATTVVVEKLVVQIKTTPAKKVVKKAKKAKKAKKHVAKKAKKNKAKKHAGHKINRAHEARDSRAVPHKR